MGKGGVEAKKSISRSLLRDIITILKLIYPVAEFKMHEEKLKNLQRNGQMHSYAQFIRQFQ